MTTHSFASRRAATAVEVLVVIAVVATAVGLLLPAVQRVRGAAARAQTGNQYRQVILAICHYTSQHDDRLPTVDGQQQDSPNWGQGSLLDCIRPYIESNTATVSRLMPDGRSYGVIPLYVSPMDPSYTITGTTEGNASVALNALLFRTPRSINAISDGTSSTLAISEHYAQCGKTAFVWSLGAAKCNSLVNGVRTPTPCVNQPHHSPTFADYPMADDYHPGPPVPARTFQPAPAVADCDYRLPQSADPGGMQAAMLDGSVRRIAPGVSPAAFWAAVTPAGGESLPLD